MGKIHNWVMFPGFLFVIGRQGKMNNSVNLQKTLYTEKVSKFVVEDMLFASFFIAILFAKNLYFQVTATLIAQPLLSNSNKLMFLSTLAVLVIYTFLIMSIFNKHRKSAIIVSNILFSAIIFADTLYFRYYCEAITIPVLFLVTLAGEVGDSVKSILKPYDFLLFIDIPIWIVCSRIMSNKRNGIKACISRKFFAFSLVIVIAFSTFYFSTTQISAGSLPQDDNYILSKQGLLYFHYYDMKRFIDESFLHDTELTPEEIKVVTDFYNNRPSGGNKYTSVAAGKNLIIVQMEAMQNFLLNLEVNGQEVTPNFNKLVNEFVYFSNFFYQVAGGNTSDAEFMCNNSLYPADNGSVYYRFYDNTFISLPSLLKTKGYDSYVFHAFKRDYWNRDNFYESIKFDSYISKENFKNTDKLGWGLSDKEFFKQTLENINTQKPFYSFLITLSSHHPFNHFEEYGDFYVGEYEGTLVGNYLKAANYVDQTIGELILELKENGLFDNSIIVLYGDHGAVQKNEFDMVKELLNIEINEVEWKKLQRVPLFIRWPKIDEPRVNNTVGGQVDILPTVGNILGIRTPFAIGKDLFNTEEGYAVFRNYDIVTDEYIYINEEERVYDWNNNELERENYINEILKLQNQLNVSDTILENDIFKNIETDSFEPNWRENGK